MLRIISVLSNNNAKALPGNGNRRISYPHRVRAIRAHKTNVRQSRRGSYHRESTDRRILRNLNRHGRAIRRGNGAVNLQRFTSIAIDAENRTVIQCKSAFNRSRAGQPRSI